MLHSISIRPVRDGGGRKRRVREYFGRYKTHFLGGIFALIVTQAFALSVPQLLKRATDALVADDLSAARDFGIALLVVALLAAGARITSRLLIFYAGREVEYDVRNDLFHDLSRQQPSFFYGMPSGQVMSRAINDLTQVRLLLGPGILNLTNTTIVYLVVVPLLFIADAELAFLCLLPLPLLGLGGRAIGRRMYEDSKEAQERLGQLSSKVQENLGGVATVRAYRREAQEEAAFSRLNDRFVEVNMRLARMRGLMFPLMGLIGAIGVVLLLWIGGERMIAGRMTVGQFVEFNAYLGALTWPTIALGWMISLWQRGLASMARINDIFGTRPTIQDGPLEPRPLEGKIELKDLTFRYRPELPPALDGVTATFEPGETVVIVGRTGSGKSTLLKAIARLLEVPRGTIFFDGADVLELPVDQVRGGISYAPQEAFLFSRTIFENVAFGKPHATDAEVEAAVRSAGLASDIGGFREGLETVVGERGVTLSGGQRQRTALARALIVNPKILLLDDTLSAVDTDTENRILGELAGRSREETTILVTHRLACAALADRILVMENGRIAEQGTEQELLERNGIYAQMHQRQRLREAIEAQAHVLPPANDEPPAPIGGAA